MKKVALCLSGHLRSYEKCFPSLQKAILEPFAPDVFIHSWSTQGFGGRGDDDLVNSEINVEAVEDLYQPRYMEVEPVKTFDLTKYTGWRVPELRNVQIPISMFYGIYHANLMRQVTESLNDFTYDTVIRCRPDLYFNNILEIEEGEALYFPKFGNYRGINDSFAYGSSPLMTQYAETYLHLENCPTFNAEYMLKFNLDRLKIPIKRSRIDYTILRSNGDNFRLNA